MPYWNVDDEITVDKLNYAHMIQDFTYGETIAVNDAVYLKASDGKVWKTNATYSDERTHNFIGFAKEAGNADESKNVQVGGKVEGFSGLTIGRKYYLSETAGGIKLIPTITASGVRFFIGIATSATELLIAKIYGKKIIYASDNLIHSNDTERAKTTTTYVKVKEIKVNEDYLENIRIKFTIRAAAGYSTYGRVYKDGSAIGTERSVYFTSGTFSEDFSGIIRDDLLQIYIKASTTDYPAYANNFRLYYGELTITSDFTNQDPA